MTTLTEFGIAREVTGRRRSRLFVYDAYLAILNEGTENAGTCTVLPRATPTSRMRVRALKRRAQALASSDQKP